ncbi:MAG: MoaD/ThiS family protein [Actinobacteria bacterium]|nr:MoaD/ThiS family protein [Actinomycetota bacterium]
MREYLPSPAARNRAKVELPGGASVADLMDELRAPHALAHAVLVDGARADLTTNLTDGAEVTLMPPFAGGRSRGDPDGR